jgi:hypothetical protein
MMVAAVQPLSSPAGSLAVEQVHLRATLQSLGVHGHGVGVVPAATHQQVGRAAQSARVGELGELRRAVRSCSGGGFLESMFAAGSLAAGSAVQPPAPGAERHRTRPIPEACQAQNTPVRRTDGAAVAVWLPLRRAARFAVPSASPGYLLLRSTLTCPSRLVDWGWRCSGSPAFFSVKPRASHLELVRRTLSIRQTRDRVNSSFFRRKPRRMHSLSAEGLQFVV